MLTGYLMIYSGLGVLGLAVILTIFVAITMPLAKKKMEEKLAEKY